MSQLVDAIRELRALCKLERKRRLAGAQRRRKLRLNRKVWKATPEARKAARKAA